MYMYQILDTYVPLGTTIVRIWGAEPSLTSVREDATRKSVAVWHGELGGYSDGGKTGGALRRSRQWEQQHLGLTFRSLLLKLLALKHGCRTVLSGNIRSFGTKVAFSLAHSDGEYNVLISKGNVKDGVIEGPWPRPTFVMGGLMCYLT